jgi:hypothetical protein
MVIIAIVRILGSLPVLLWPFPGGVLAVLTDLSDLFLREQLDLGGVKGYQRFDKWLDQVYMLTFLAVALRWEPVPRNIAVGLYAYRLIGFIAFEISGERDLLLLFPNVFEVWFLFVAGVNFFNVRFEYRGTQLAAVAIVLLSVKLLQEYAIHTGRWLDSFTPSEAVEALWDWLTAPFH